MTRRRLLGVLALVVCLGLATFLWRPPSARRIIVRLLRPRLDTRTPTGVLTASEMEDLVAFAGVLAAERALTAAERPDVIEHVEERTRNRSGYLSLYRMTVAVLARLSGGAAFASLAPEQRVAVVARHRLGPLGADRMAYLWPFDRDRLAVRVLAVPDLIHAYYASASGWAVVGYSVFPGRPSDLRRYTRPEPAPGRGRLSASRWTRTSA